MRIIRWLFLMAVCVVLVSCSDTERYTQYINEQLESHYPSEADKYEFIVVIPRQGCHACIQAVESFFYTTKKEPNYLFIFTRIDSPKKLKLEIGADNLALDNVRIDKENLFYNPEYYDSNYPLLLHKASDGTFTYQRLSVN